jgi:phage shock protein PspC (stress-responsive transcriptional regulator)
MNEVTHIHLGRQQFTIAVDAHHALRAYLAAIQKQVASKDVTEEVELRMAELLGEQGVDGQKVVLMKDVDYLKQQLGEPSEFIDEEGPKHHEAAEFESPKRLFRDADNALLAGVCAGLAKYFGIDVIIVRLMFAALIFFGGSGFLLYVVLWLVVPEAKTPSDRLQMQGRSVTVGSIKQVVDRADVPGAARRSRSAIGPVIETAAGILVKILGSIFLLVGVAMLFALTTFGIYAFVTQGRSIVGQAFFPVGVEESVLLVSGLAVGAIVAFIFVLMGLAMINRKWKIPGWVSATIAGLLILAIATTASLGAGMFSTLQQHFDSLHHTQMVSTGPFKNVVLHGDKTNFIFQPDASYKLEYRYLGNPGGSVTKSITGDTLNVDTASFVSPSCRFLCLNGRDLTVVVHAPSLAAVTVLGNDARFSNAAAFNQDGLRLTLDRSSGADLRFVNPGYLQFATNPDQDRNTTTITGLRAGAFESDEVQILDGTIFAGRAGTFELKTDAGCRTGEPLATLPSFPDKLILNGQVFPTKGDLLSIQNGEQPLPFNCVQTF